MKIKKHLRHMKIKNILIGLVAIVFLVIIAFLEFKLINYMSEKYSVDNIEEPIVTEPLIIETNKEARMRHPYEAEINIIGSENTEPIVFEGLIVEIAMKEDGTLKIVSTDSIRKYYSNKDIEREWFDE